MIHQVLNLKDAPAGAKYLLRFVGDPVPSRCVYVREEDTPVRRIVVDAVGRLEALNIKIYREAFAICTDVHGDGNLFIAHLPEQLTFAIQRFVQAGGTDPGEEESYCLLVEIGTGSPLMATVTAKQPSDLETSVYECASAIKSELYEVAGGKKATVAEVLDFKQRDILCNPYFEESEAWFEPEDMVEIINNQEVDKISLYEKFLTYVSECCDDEDVAMVAGILCRIKETK